MDIYQQFINTIINIMKEIIQEKLIREFAPSFLEIINNSHLHQNHFVAPNLELQNQTHFMIKISAQCFNGMTKINIHRQINKILSDEFKRGLHALEIKVI